MTTASPWAALLDWTGSLSIWIVGLALLWFVLTGLGALISKYRRVKIVYGFCVGLGSSYSASFVFNMIALAIHGDLPSKNILWPVFTWLAVAVMCLWQALFRGGSPRPAFWAYIVNGIIAVLPLFFAGHAFITVFTALPLFGVALLLRSNIRYMSFEGYTDDEIKTWLWLRAIEWGSFPAFLSQPVAPVLFIFYPWYFVVLAVFVLGLMWCLIRYWFVSARLARVACLAVPLLKWPAVIGSSIYLFIRHQPVAALVALIWPFVAAYCSLPAKIGVIELAFAKKIGFVSPDTDL